MTPYYRILLIVAVGFLVLAGAEFVRADSDADLPPDPIRGGELDPGAEYDVFLGACRVGLIVQPNQSCTVSGGSLTNVGSGCVNYSPFGTGRICSASFNLNGLQGTRVGDDFRITAAP